MPFSKTISYSTLRCQFMEGLKGQVTEAISLSYRDQTEVEGVPLRGGDITLKSRKGSKTDAVVVLRAAIASAAEARTRETYSEDGAWLRSVMRDNARVSRERDHLPIVLPHQCLR